MAKQTDKITKSAEGDEKAFKGDGMEGKKGAPNESAETSTDAPDQAPPPADTTQPPADPPASQPDPVDHIGEMKKKLADLRARHERLSAEEDAKGFIDGRMVSERKARRAEIESLEHELKTIAG